MTPNTKAVISFLDGRTAGVTVGQILAAMEGQKDSKLITLGLMLKAGQIFRCGFDAAGHSLWMLGERSSYDH